MVPNLRRASHYYSQSQELSSAESDPQVGISSWSITRGAASFFHDLSFYARHPTFLPSFSASILYFTVLNFGGQMTTFLLDAGYTSTWVGITRAVSVVSEILATWAAPITMTRLGPIRAGLWFVSWQVAFLAVAVSIFWGLNTSISAVSGLVGGVILSRVGLRGFDLCTQVIIQDVSLQASYIAPWPTCSNISFTSSQVTGNRRGPSWQILLC